MAFCKCSRRTCVEDQCIWRCSPLPKFRQINQPFCPNRGNFIAQVEKARIINLWIVPRIGMQRGSQNGRYCNKCQEKFWKSHGGFSSQRRELSPRRFERTLNWLSLRSNPVADLAFQHRHRQRAGVQYLIVELARIELVAERVLGFFLKPLDGQRADFIGQCL